MKVVAYMMFLIVFMMPSLELSAQDAMVGKWRCILVVGGYEEQEDSSIMHFKENNQGTVSDYPDGNQINSFIYSQNPINREITLQYDNDDPVTFKYKMSDDDTFFLYMSRSMIYEFIEQSYEDEDLDTFSKMLAEPIMEVFEEILRDIPIIIGIRHE